MSYLLERFQPCTSGAVSQPRDCRLYRMQSHGKLFLRQSAFLPQLFDQKPDPLLGKLLLQHSFKTGGLRLSFSNHAIYVAH